MGRRCSLAEDGGRRAGQLCLHLVPVCRRAGDLPRGACLGEGGVCAEKPGAGGEWKHPSGLGKVAFACG